MPQVVILTIRIKQKQNCGNSNFADLAIFSFHPVKHIAAGEGGMITTNDEGLYKKTYDAAHSWHNQVEQ